MTWFFCLFFKHVAAFMHGNAHAMQLSVKFVQKGDVFLYQGKLLENLIKGNKAALSAFREEPFCLHALPGTSLRRFCFCGRRSFYRTPPPKTFSRGTLFEGASSGKKSVVRKSK